MTPALQEIFDRVAAQALDKQLYLRDQIGEHAWNFSMDDGLLRLEADTGGVKLAYPAQVLGSESLISGTWLWAWGQEDAVPPNLLKASLAVKEWGEKQGVAELTTRKFPLDEDLTGHHVAMAASGLLDASFYYRGPYEGGAIFLLVKQASYVRNVAAPLSRAAEIFPNALKSMPIKDHKQALVDYLGFCGMEVLTHPPGPEGSAIIGRLPGAGQLIASFDLDGRLIRLLVQGAHDGDNPGAF